MPIESAYSDIKRLVARFKSLSAAARRAYNEDNTRKDFIMSLFRALEWDTQDSAEVSAEEKVSLTGVQRRVEGGQSAAGAVHRVRRGQLSDRLRAAVVALPARNQ